MRPNSIVLFEKIFLAGAVTAIVAIFVHYGAWRSFAISRGGAAASPLIGIVLAAVVSGLFWFFIARRGSNIARWLLWISIALALIGLPESLARARMIGPGYAVPYLFGTLLQALASLLLVRKDSRLWFRHKGRPPESLTDVFD